MLALTEKVTVSPWHSLMHAVQFPPFILVNLEENLDKIEWSLYKPVVQSVVHGFVQYLLCTAA